MICNFALRRRLPYPPTTEQTKNVSNNNDASVLHLFS